MNRHSPPPHHCHCRRRRAGPATPRRQRRGWAHRWCGRCPPLPRWGAGWLAAAARPPTARATRRLPALGGGRGRRCRRGVRRRRGRHCRHGRHAGGGATLAVQKRHVDHGHLVGHGGVAIHRRLGVRRSLRRLALHAPLLRPARFFAGDDTTGGGPHSINCPLRQPRMNYALCDSGSHEWRAEVFWSSRAAWHPHRPGCIPVSPEKASANG